MARRYCRSCQKRVQAEANGWKWGSALGSALGAAAVHSATEKTEGAVLGGLLGGLLGAIVFDALDDPTCKICGAILGGLKRVSPKTVLS